MPGPGFKKNPQNINRKGRPKKGQTMTDILNEYLDEPINTRSTKTRKEALIKKTYTMATAKGGFTAIKYIFDRLDGMPTQKIEGEQDITYRIGKPKELKPKPRPQKKPAKKKLAKRKVKKK